MKDIMLSKPDNGWTRVRIGDFMTEASYLTDIPFEWLRACLYGLRYNYPISFFIDEEGATSTVTTHWNQTYIICDDCRDVTVQRIPDVDWLDITFCLINDIKAYFDDWVEWLTPELNNSTPEERSEELKNLLEEAETELNTVANKVNKHFF